MKESVCQRSNLKGRQIKLVENKCVAEEIREFLEQVLLFNISCKSKTEKGEEPAVANLLTACVHSDLRI